jgi:hypothetical protein
VTLWAKQQNESSGINERYEQCLAQAGENLGQKDKCNEDKEAAKAATNQIRDRKQRALKVITALLQYAATYGKDAGEQAQQDRRAILEAFTEEMTSREGRRGDTIFSLGGSLRLSPGVKTNFEDIVIGGPVSLPLGLGLSHLAESEGAPGFHMEISVFDLGQYASVDGVTGDDGVAGAEPELEDALAPSLRLGVQWGTDLPVILAASAGWVPHYEGFESAKNGALTASLNLGIYVPLFDVN